MRYLLRLLKNLLLAVWRSGRITDYKIQPQSSHGLTTQSTQSVQTEQMAQIEKGEQI